MSIRAPTAPSGTAGSDLDREGVVALERDFGAHLDDGVELDVAVVLTGVMSISGAAITSIDPETTASA
jgi:hypothetical protein